MDETQQTQTPTRKRKCWIAFDLLYTGYGPTEELALLDMEIKRDDHLKAMSYIPKTDKKDSQ